MRAFLAVELPQQVREALATIQRSLGSQLPAVRWVRPESLHLTLVFLGEIGQDDAERLTTTALSTCADVQPCTVRVGGLGRFPPRGRLRVLWAGVDDPEGCLGELHRRLEGAARDAGLPLESRSYRPHLTLGRSRSPGRSHGEIAAAQVQRAMLPFDGGCIGEVPVRRCHLYQSLLGPGGARYRVHGTFPLGSPEVSDR